jgi:polygalacturonase
MMMRLTTRMMMRLAVLAHATLAAAHWRVCDVALHYDARGDGVSDDTASIRAALQECSEVVLPLGRKFVTGPLNLTSNQLLRVDGELLASTNVHDYPLVAPLLGYGWGNDKNCFAPDQSPHKIIVGSLRYSPVVGAFHATNVSVVGMGTIDGRGEIWWQNCTACHYPPHNDSRFCEIASRPKLLEFQFVDRLRVHGEAAAPLTLKDSPFWTLTPSYSQNIEVRDLRVLAPMDKIGNTDGVNLDSCRNALVSNIYINNSDDGVCMKSGLDGFGMNLAIPTEDVLVTNITCAAGGRCGFAIGSEMSGGVRNVTYRDSVLAGERGINLKPSVGRGGYIRDLHFENITLVRAGISMSVGRDGEPIEPGNDYVPLVADLSFADISGGGGCHFDCAGVNGSACHNVRFSGAVGSRCKCNHCAGALPPPRYACKPTAAWGVCLPLDAPVNNDPHYPNWGPTTGDFASLEACKAQCT